MSLLNVEDLRIEFGRHRRVGVSGVSFSVEPGQRLGIIGESGSGKTVTALAIMGLLAENAHVSGSIEFNGQSLLDLSDKQMSKLRGKSVSMVFQEPMTALDPTMKVGRQTAEVVCLHDRSKETPSLQRVLDIFAQVGLSDPARVANSYPHQLSGGQRQRALIAMALMNQPDLVICDEPTTALDVTVQAKVLAMIDRELSAAQAACIFISHDLAVVSQICDSVLVMRSGKIIESGSIADVMGNPQHPYTKGLVATSRLDLITPGSVLPTVSDFLDKSSDRDGETP